MTGSWIGTSAMPAGYREYHQSIATDDPIALLETLAPETLATLHENLRSTIIPARSHSTAGERAMELFEQLSRGSETGQLQTGEVIGEGGMGVIRAATQLALGRGVAVKTLKPGRADRSAALDLLREAWVTGAIEHPNVVPVHYLQIDQDGIPVIVMKRIAGVEWSALLGDASEVNRRFGASDLLAWNLGILMSVLNALHYAHSRGIIHRDLKPSNVMIGDFGEVYLLDWGIAVSLRDDGSGRLPLAANATVLAGTPHYMAPEMLGQSGGSPISERTDVYLAGSVLFELIAGHPPHAGSTAGAVFASVLASAPTIPTGAPPELARICERAMHAQPTERFESAEAMRLAVQAYLGHRGSADLSARAAVRVDELLAVLAAAPAAHAEAEADRRESIYRLFDACRFGFHEALSVWADNADARAGLVCAITAVAEYELRTENPKAAVTLLGELASPPAEILARARAAAAAQSRRLADLERLRSQQDPTTGRRTRSFLSVLFGVTFTWLPLVNEAFGARFASSHQHNGLISVVMLGIVCGVLFWARNSILATAVNRRLSGTGIFVFFGHLILSLGAWALDVSVVETQVFMIFYWGAVMAMLAIHLDHWLWPSAVLFFACFLLAAAHPHLRFYAMAAGNFGFAVNAYVRWAPDTLLATPDERVARRARDEHARQQRRRPR
ncbi:MAG: serine/threonine protein kinase [Deltaproteobacteria bacterium]|nr:serine/threonine protein kinase [Deltaproteobacteria bacterium]